MDESERPNLADGIAAGALEPGDMLLGRVGDDEVLLARTASRFLAVSPYCTHYHGPLIDGLVVGETVRCPLHHSCFSLRNGALLRAPALDPLECWKVVQQGDMVFVKEKAAPPEPPAADTLPSPPPSVVIIGGGGAGLVAADTLRREGYGGPISIISADDEPPCDRPNLSKDYLAGEAQEDWMPLRSPEYFTGTAD